MPATPYGEFFFDAPDRGETGLVFLFKAKRREPVAYVELGQAKRLARQLEDEAAEANTGEEA